MDHALSWRSVLAAGFLAASLFQFGVSARGDEASDLFESQIRPVLVDICFRCHGDAKVSGGLRVDSREGLMAGGDSGAAIVAGKPEESLLIRAIERQADVSAMPPENDKALRPDQIAAFRAWIAAGAVWPETSPKFVAAKHWSFEPLRDKRPPEVQDRAWPQSSIDPFIRVKQEAAGVQPAPEADKLALIRRATFDLTGLPPTPDEVAAFVGDDSPNAFDKVVDRLLASPHYGERWGRHWLDVVRYADTAGETADYPSPLAWRYRNYVIEAFNDDKPYDEFLREQIAGDVLAAQGAVGILATAGDLARYAERTTATGYLAISRRFGFDSENYHHLTIQDTIDTLGQSVLGLSLGCARCHDHKFDPVTMDDYYALFGIFDSSRYAFPGSEQKQKVRSLLPLLPASESLPKWREYESRVAALAALLERHNRPVPGAVLRSLDDLDGDFEMQAPAAGGSNGVLVPPWLYEGNIAVTNAAQSLFKNLHPRGRVGVFIPAGSGKYRIAQAIRRERLGDVVYVNLDFRVGAEPANPRAIHSFSLGSLMGAKSIDVLISSQSVALRSGDKIESIYQVSPGEWTNLQLALDLRSRTASGRIGKPGAVTEFSSGALESMASGEIEAVIFDGDAAQDSLDSSAPARPSIEYDNLGVQNSPIPAVSTEILGGANDEAGIDDGPALAKQIEELTGFDGDFEMQANDLPPASPWGPGPNSVVKLSNQSQSEFHNLFPAGELGVHMPNRAEYDGFGRTLANVKPGADGKLFASFDFRCASVEAGGNGSWRYYLGHGPGNSAAVELFFSGNEFFRRSGDAREAVSRLAVGEWYQVQVTLDLNAKTYVGELASKATKTEFSGQLASGWDGVIDYTFIDSYGHLGGVRPSLDADNFVVAETAPAAPTSEAGASIATRREAVLELRKRLAANAESAERAGRELNELLAAGPFPMAYGMAEGTPHNARTQMRGEPDKLGVEVERGFVKALGGVSLPKETRGSGRLELAQWLTSPEHPLTARVMVNRIWRHHFGRGLVKTPNDFGLRGLSPTHPELLDHLAAEFVRSGWSLKAMHRLMMLSATYRQASPAGDLDDAAQHRDGDLYASFARRRLSAEEIRDAILAVSGELDETPGREHPFPTPIQWGYTQHAPFSAVYEHNRRSVYLMTQRIKRHPFLALFDGADPNASTAERLGTTAPTQALFFLNDPFVHAKADRWAARILAASPDASEQLERAWLGAVGRRPTSLERDEGLEFLLAYREELSRAGGDNLEHRSLAAYLRTLLSENEFLHVD